MIEALRKQVTEQSLNTADLGTRSEKIAAQLRDIQEVSYVKISFVCSSNFFCSIRKALTFRIHHA